MLASKDEALKALNHRLMEMERKVQTQGKEIVTMKAKAQEEKDQLYVEAKGNERAKANLQALVLELQDSEKEYKTKIIQG